MGSMVFTSKGGVRRCSSYTFVHVCVIVMGCIFLLHMCEIHIPCWSLLCGAMCCSLRCNGHQSRMCFFWLVLLVVMPRSAAAVETSNNVAALWRQPSVCKFGCEEAMLAMAVQCFGAWRQRCPNNFFQDCRLSQGQLRGVHREAGRALKRMCQVSAWAYCKQQWSRHCPYCKKTWVRCGCCIHLAPRDWHSSCNVTVDGSATFPQYAEHHGLKIWQVIRVIETIKGYIYKDFLSSSPTHYDKKLCAFWSMLEAKFGVAHTTSTGVLYMLAAPWCCHSYIGQTNGNGWTRLQSHRYACLSGKQSGKVYDKLRQMHFSSFVFVPLCDLSTCAATVADRLFVEAQAIAIWKPTLNVQGTPASNKYSNEYVSLVFPRRVQDRPLMHARGIVQQDPAALFPPSAILGPRERPGAHGWRQRLSVAVSVSRRPIRQRGVVNLGLLQSIQSWHPSYQMRITLTAMRCLGIHRRAIFLQNMSRALGAFSFRRIAISSHLGFSASVRKCFQQQLQCTLSAAYKFSMTITVVKLCIRPISCPSLLDLVDNSRRILECSSEPTVCPCAQAWCHDWRLLDGHVCDSLQGVRGHIPWDWPDTWTARSRFKPDVQQVCEDLQSQFNIACRDTCPSLSAFAGLYDSPSIQHTVERSLLRFSTSPSILQGRQAAAVLSDFACIPVDRAKGELAVLCPQKYWRMGQCFLKSCNAVPVSLGEVIHFNQNFFVWPNKLEVLPFCHLRRGREHRFGQLTLHVKAKSLFPLCATWTSLKLRPLVSYRRHHWRHLLSNTCRALNFIQQSVAPGFVTLCAASFCGKIRKFNDDTAATFGTCDVTASLHIDDIEDFFTKAPRDKVLDAVHWACSRLRQQSGHEYVCIPRTAKVFRRNIWIFADKPGPCGWRSFKPKRELHAMTASIPPDPRLFYCLALRDIPGILAHDWKFAWFLVGGILYKQPTGFAQGSPASSGAANLFAAVCEERWLRQKPVVLQQHISLHLCAARWMDDRLLVWRPGFNLCLLHELRDPAFYAQECRLKPTHDNKFIGLRVFFSRGSLCTIPWSSHCDHCFLQRLPRAGRLMSTLSFGSDSAVRGHLLGHLVRVLDFSIGTRASLQAAVFFLLVELEHAGHSRRRLLKLLWRVHAKMPFLDIPLLMQDKSLSVQCAAWHMLALCSCA